MAVPERPAAERRATALSGFNGTLAECIRELMAKPVKQISLYDIVTEPQPVFDRPVLSPGDAAEIAMRKDFPKG
jgi:hypothetical protein